MDELCEDNDMYVNIVGEKIGIKEYFEKEGYTYYVFNEEPKRIIKFDNVYAKWMNRLYILIAHIGEERDKHSIDISKMEFDSKYQFFGLAESVANQLMYFFVKDQLSGCNDNKELEGLCYNILFGPNNSSSYGHVVFDELCYLQLKKYLARLVMWEFNAFTAGQFYDFYVSYWSCFEACLNLICEPYEAKIREKQNDSQFKEMKKFLKGLYGARLDYGEIIGAFDNENEKFNKKFGKYVSFPDKYIYLIKEVIGDNYTRNEKKDRDFLEFCGAFRNTVHNNGVHLKADKQIEVRGEIFRLQKGNKQYTDDFSKIFILAEELFDIYVAIVDGLDALKKCES